MGRSQDVYCLTYDNAKTNFNLSLAIHNPRCIRSLTGGALYMRIAMSCHNWPSPDRMTHIGPRQRPRTSSRYLQRGGVVNDRSVSVRMSNLGLLRHREPLCILELAFRYKCTRVVKMCRSYHPSFCTDNCEQRPPQGNFSLSFGQYLDSSPT